MVKIKETYKCVIPDEIRILLKRPPIERTQSDISNLMQFFSTMSCFEKYDDASQRLFLSRGVYNKWNDPGRRIIKEGHKASNFYIILDGQVKVTKLNQELVEALSVEARTKEAVLESCSFEVAKLHSGASFGEIAFIDPSQKRTASIYLVKPTEFLIIDAKEADALGKIKNDKTLGLKLGIIEQSPILRSLKPDKTLLAYFCSLKSYANDLPIVTEGEESDYFYIIRKGQCRMVKTLHVSKKMDGSRIIKDNLSDKNFDKLQLVVVGQLEIMDHFGEGIAFQNTKGILTRLPQDTSTVSIIPNTKMDALLVPKADVCLINS